MAKYLAGIKCQYRGRIYNKDEVLKYTGIVIACPVCKGKKAETVCKTCKDTGRIEPPHHFKEIGDGHAKEEEKGEEVLVGDDVNKFRKNARDNDNPEYVLATEAAKKEKELIRNEIIRLGSSYHGTWGIDKLKMHLIKIQKECGEKNTVPEIPKTVQEEVTNHLNELIQVREEIVKLGGSCNPKESLTYLKTKLIKLREKASPLI